MGRWGGEEREEEVFVFTTSSLVAFQRISGKERTTSNTLPPWLAVPNVAQCSFYPSVHPSRQTDGGYLRKEFLDCLCR